jgi:Ribbon-helix-helix protein, copG family
MRTTVRLPDDLLKRAQRKAAAEGRTLTALMEEGLTQILADAPNKTRRERVLPRVSTATGGLMPGIDPIKIASDIEEADDIGTLRRHAAGR